jgi:hypothetical protein
MSGAHQVMHSQRNTALEGLRAICKQSAMPLETPPPGVWNVLVSNRKPLPSADETVKMQEHAS